MPATDSPGPSEISSLVTSKYGQRTAVRRPASFAQADTSFDVPHVELGGAEEDPNLSTVDAIKIVSELAGQPGIYSSLSAYGAMNLSASEQWSNAFARQGAFTKGEGAQLPALISSAEPVPDDEEYYDDKITQDHMRVLYLVSLYSKPAENDEEKEVWIRSHATMVLIFEGIVTGVLNYDYSSCAQVIGQTRLWMNISQEGKDDLDDLREMKFINTIKLSTVNHGYVVAYQISFKGQKMLKRKLTQSSQDAVNSFSFTADGTPLHVGLEDGHFFFYTQDSEYKIQSKVTETEDVSYVSSPYLPDCIRRGPRGMTSNAHRAYESAAGKSDIKDEYNEVISLGEVRILIGEWVPFGDNAISCLLDKLGCQDRVQGGFFSEFIDTEPEEEKLETSAGLTNVRILEFDLLNYVNFEADIHFAEDEGIVQVENFGTHIRSDGFVIYGLKIEAVMDHGADNVSLDLMSRLLMDIQNDSSRIIDSLVSEYQRSILDTIFYGDRETRDKFNIVIAEMINPKIKAELYLDNGENESELKQVLGDTYSSHNLSDDDILVVGRMGLLIAGRGCRKYEPLLISYLTLVSREKFLRYFFARVFLMDKTLREIRYQIDHYDEDPSSISNILKMVAEVSRGVILLDECLLYIEESLAHISLARAGEDTGLQTLSKILNAGVLFESLKRHICCLFVHADLLCVTLMHCRRTADMRKNVKGTAVELVSIQKMAGVISETQQAYQHDIMDLTCRRMADVQRNVEKSMAHLDIMKSLLSGIFAMELFDRLMGLNYNITGDGGKTVLPSFMEPLRNIIPVPGFILALILLFWLLLSKVWYERRYNKLAAATTIDLNLSVKYVVNVSIDVARLNDMLAYKYILQEEVENDDLNAIRKTVYLETDVLKWRGFPPKISLHFDEEISFILQVTFYLNRTKARLTSQEVFKMFVEDLALAKVITVEQSKDLITKNTAPLDQGKSGT